MSGFNIGTGYQPQGVYPERFTQQVQHQARAMGTPTMPGLRLGRQQQGVSTRSPMSQYGMGLDLASSLAQASAAPAQIGMQHQFANAGNLMQGQIGREQEAQGWGQQGLQNYQSALQNQLSRQNSLLNLFQGLNRWGG